MQAEREFIAEASDKRIEKSLIFLSPEEWQLSKMEPDSLLIFNDTLPRVA